jgi:hypothetical protein
MSSGGDWLRPNWLVDAVRSWTPSARVPPSLAEAMRPAAELFGFAPATVGKELIDAAASRLVGRSITINAGDTDVELVLRLLQLERPPIGLMIGQLGDVALEAEDVGFSGVRVGRLRLDVRNLHVQPGLQSASVVAAPIRVRAELDHDVISDAVSRWNARVIVELHDGGVARAFLAGRRDWGHVDVVPRVDGRTLFLEPQNVTVRTWKLASLIRRLPPLRIGLPNAIAAAHIKNVDVEDGRVVLDGVYEEWRWELSPKQLDELRRQVLRFDGGVLQIPRA